ncbi:substrate-binding domain-containing protein [Campylobacter blaseri]|uniref:substrate-binding domain-containing protein n=1 Tax=Campylobacter blaseri TaxID=2042961 RepID=UPI0019D4EDB0|nr:substrate-binding domain-containing protein [Campylobacter blaseri]
MSANQDCTKIYGDGNEEIRLATGSPGELGLLEAIFNDFAKDKDVRLCWIKAGSGKSLELLKDKKIDIAMVHAPKAEKEAIMEDWAKNRTLIGSNEFYIVGDKKDPAEVYTNIAEKKVLFYIRADDSGTHKKELSIWEKAGIEPKGDWYVANKDFMLATLKKSR